MSESRFDPIANTYRDAVPPCPFCGKPPRTPAISPPAYIECSGCWLRVPAGQWRRIAEALSADLPTQYEAACRVRDQALATLQRHGEHIEARGASMRHDVARMEGQR